MLRIIMVVYLPPQEDQKGNAENRDLNTAGEETACAQVKLNHISICLK